MCRPESEGPAVNPYRLPTNVRPSRYDLTMAPDLSRRDFVGELKIAIELAEPTDRVTCNAIDLTITAAWVVSDDGTRNDATASLDVEMERVTFVCQRTIPTGPSTLHVQFTGILNDKLVGFYASSYEADDGSTKVIATTQMEATDARRAFPCWDEPDAKAVFAITLIVAPSLMAVSNMHEVSSSTLPSGKRAVRFADTPIMSAYLVCMVVGDLEATDPVDVGGIPLRVIARPGRQAQAAFALEIGAFALRYFQDWYGIAYPGTKMDLIATPDFAFGAMENLGAVTFREALLLVDQTKASKPELERIADVVAHEIAHMWFGDLVTMKWWNGLWLNEAFATFAEVSCVAKFRPEWDRWTSFAIYRSMAQQVDALHSTRPIEFPVISPSDADAMFDVLTYEKGASVLRMLEQYLGEERFRLGVKHYLETHAFANAETTDLWDAIEQTTGEPVRRLMDSWILQGGFPIVHASRGDNGAITLTQTPFTYLTEGDDDRTWEVPVLYRRIGAPAAEAGSALLCAAPVSIAAGDGGNDGVIVNAGGHGFYRVNYDDALAQQVQAAFTTLDPVERYGVVSDSWAGVLAGSASIASFLDVVRALGSERDPNVWSVTIAAFRRLDAIVDETSRPQLQTLVRKLLGPIVEELGISRAADESPLTSALRGMVTEALGTIGDDAGVGDRAAAMFDRVVADDGSVDPDLGPALLSVAAAHGNPDRYARLALARKAATSPQAELRFLHALGEFSDPVLVSTTLVSLLSDEVRTQDAPYALLRMLGSRRNGPATWAFIRDQWAAIVERLPEASIPRMLEGITTLTSEPSATEIETFFTNGPGAAFAKDKKTMSQHLERLRVQRRLAGRSAEAASALAAS